MLPKYPDCITPRIIPIKTENFKELNAYPIYTAPWIKQRREVPSYSSRPITNSVKRIFQTKRVQNPDINGKKLS